METGTIAIESLRSQLKKRAERSKATRKKVAIVRELLPELQTFVAEGHTVVELSRWLQEETKGAVVVTPRYLSGLIKRLSGEAEAPEVAPVQMHRKQAGK